MSKPYTVCERLVQFAAFTLWPLGILLSIHNVILGVIVVAGFPLGVMAVDYLRTGD